MNNPAFWRAIHSLAHPVSLAAILVLLLNDHVLRIYSPSWLTGKLGDFAWLVFAPFICAALFAWLIRTRQQEKVIGIAAFAFIGVWFALAKTTPLVHGWTLDALEIVVGYRASLRIDPTDLITLPALLIGWHIWRGAATTPQTVKAYAWVWLALGTFATVATSQGPVDYGIVDFCQQDNQLYAYAFGVNSGTAAFVSTDGGISWQSIPMQQNTEVPCLGGTASSYYQYFQPRSFSPNSFTDGERMYHYEQGKFIKSSVDGGQTWILEVDLTELALEPRVNYYREVLHREYRIGPVLYLVDIQTGNVLFAMGHDGVLVRTPDGAWRWSSLGDYRYLEYDPADGFTSLINNEWLTALMLMTLAPITICRPFKGMGWGRIGMLVLAWAVWILSTVGMAWFVGSLRYSIGSLFLVPFAFASGVGICLSVEAFVTSYQYNLRATGVVLLLSLGAGLLFMLPYVMWTRGTILYDNAALYALAIGITALLSGALHLRRAYPDFFKSKRQPSIAQRLAAGELVADDDDDEST